MIDDVTTIDDRSTSAFWADLAWIDDAPVRGVRVVVAAGIITAVHRDADPRPGDVRLPGMVFPGFANAHSHVFHRALRGRTQAGRGSFWTWRERMYDLAGRLTPERYYALARAAYAEMALVGVTAVGEFHYVHHDSDGRRYTDPNAMGVALRQAASDAGVRLTLLDTCYLEGGIGQPLTGAQLRFGDGNVQTWAERVGLLADSAAGTSGGAGFKLGAAIHSVRAVPPPAIRAVAAWATDQGTALHVHLSEQPAENAACLAAYGRTPTRVLADEGALGPDTTAVHAVHLDAADIDMLGTTSTAVCACPTTEQDLADGIPPTQALRSAGVRFCLGSDQHAMVDLLTEARLLEMHERLAGGQRGVLEPATLVAALTRNGHAALGWSGNGRLAVGSAADLVAVRTDSIRTVGADPAQLVLVSTAADVDTVVVGGRIVVSDGCHVLGDVAPLLDIAIATLWESS